MRRFTSQLLLALATGMSLPAAGALAASPAPLSWRQAQAHPSARQAPGSAPLSSFPSPSSESELYGDTCVSSTACWAVGYYVGSSSATLGQMFRFDGTAWSAVSLPEPAGQAASAYDYLDAVTCTSSSACWAVGYYGDSPRRSRNQTLRWNGKLWREVPAPVSQAGRNELHAVTCVSAADCWAVGDYTNAAGAYLNEALHWNGKKWTAVATPDPQGHASGEQNVLYGVACSSRSDCLAVGYAHNGAGAYLAESLRWNGKRWLRIPTPQPGGVGGHGYGYLGGVACLSASNCWAVGGYHNTADAYVNESLQWDGAKWTVMPIFDPAGNANGADNELVALWCLSASDCWAVGYYYTDPSSAQLNQALQWNGKTWTQVATPQPGGTFNFSYENALYGVSCANASACWAVGFVARTTGGSLNQALRWDGTRWSVN